MGKVFVIAEVEVPDQVRGETRVGYFNRAADHIDQLMAGRVSNVFTYKDIRQMKVDAEGLMGVFYPLSKRPRRPRAKLTEEAAHG